MKEDAKNSNDQQPYPILLDVTNDQHVPGAVKQLKEYLYEHKKDLIAVVNNAGINPEAAIMNNDGTTKVENVLVDPSVGSSVFETNVLGVARVTKACLPLLSRGATIVNIGSYFGSIAGLIGLDHCYYESSKFALEGMSDNMRRSLKKEGIRVVLVKPGNISTDMNALGEVGAIEVAKDIEHAITSLKPRDRYYPGKVKGYSTRLVCWFYDMLPYWVSDNM